MRGLLGVLLLCAWVAAGSAASIDEAKRDCNARGRVFLEELDARGITVRWCCQP